MSNPKPKGKAKPPAIELDPDAWPKFEQFIKDITKAGPKHRPAKQGSGSKGRVRNGEPRA